jgi:hypothetical protein
LPYNIERISTKERKDEKEIGRQKEVENRKRKKTRTEILEK